MLCIKEIEVMSVVQFNILIYFFKSCFPNSVESSPPFS